MSNRMMVNGVKLPFLTDQNVADEVQCLLAEFGTNQKPILAPPIPVDDIVELYLKLDFELIDFKAEFGVNDIHGALWVNDKKIGVDVSLDPDENPSKLGRYRFTLAHEVGHWRLHRRLFQKRAVNQLNLVADGKERPEYICRSSDKRAPIEFQADMYAAHLLMPEAFVRRVWHEITTSNEPLSLEELRAQPNLIIQSDIDRRMRYKSGPDAEDQAIMESAAQPLADIFEVSAPAMRLRLDKLKLLVKKKEKSLFDGLD